MQKNWYIIYTKLKAEKKISTALTKRKIENYLPVNIKTVLQSRKIKIQNEPLFPSYLFVNISENEMESIISMDKVINFVYWKKHLIKVADEDIILLKKFTTTFKDIKVKKIDVNINHASEIIDGSHRFFSGNLLTIKNTIAKVNLPTLGYFIFAEIESGNKFHSENTSVEKYLHLQ